MFVVWGSDRSGDEGRAGKPRDEVLTWKKKYNKGIKVDAPATDEFLLFLEDRGAKKFDVVTIPPPSFHNYGSYPAELLLSPVIDKMGFNLDILWPERYKKKGKVATANIGKEYPPPSIQVKGKFVLVLDDIGTTGCTLAACMRSIAIAGGYPMAVAYA